MADALDPWLAENLRCPREDHGRLAWTGRTLVCASGHSFPVIDGVPVMLLDDKPDTEPVFHDTLELARMNPLYKDPRRSSLAPDEIDHIAQRCVAGSCGQMYIPLINKLKRYPIPYLRLPPSAGGRFLDIGCSWGRWSLAAAVKGYRTVGIDPSIYNVFAARRIAIQLGCTQNIYLVADGRYLPFADGRFDAAFSYSTLQHMSEHNVRLVLYEVKRALAPAGVSLMELPNKWGIRNLYAQMRRGFRSPTYTEVRYWRPRDLISTFTECIGPTKLTVDGYLSINPQTSDFDMLPLRYKIVILASEGLRRTSVIIPGLKYLADSFYMISSRREACEGRKIKPARIE